MSDRHQFSRWEKASDRFILGKWLYARRPYSKLKWMGYDYDCNVLFRLRMGEARIDKAANRYELQQSRPGWRRVVADEIKQMRRKLRRQSTSECPKG